MAAQDFSAFLDGDDTVVRVLIIGSSRNEAEEMFNILRKAGLGVRPSQIDEIGEFVSDSARQDWDLIVQQQTPGVDLNLTALAAIADGGTDAPIIVLVEEFAESLSRELLDVGVRRVLQKGQPDLWLASVRAELSALGDRRAARRYEKLYWESQRRCTSLLASSNDAIAYIADGMHLFVNRMYLELFGYRDEADLHGLPVLDLVEERDSVAFRRFMRGLGATSFEESTEVLCSRPNGQPFRALMAFSEATYDGEACFQVVVRNLSEQDALRAQLDRMRSRDRLTGLFNHLAFLSLVTRYLPGEGRPPPYVGLIELSNFRRIRKSIGLASSDNMVKELADAMTSALPSREHAARIGDDTFAVLLPNANRERAQAVFETIRERVEAHICVVGEQSVATTCSIGVVTAQPSWNAENALAAADEACRQAIRAGGNRVLFQGPAKTSHNEVSIGSMIPAIIESGDAHLSLLYQPIVSLHGQSDHCYEVLLKVKDAEGVVLPTDQVFAAAAQQNLATALDCWVIEHAIAMAEKRRAIGHEVRFFLKLSEHAIKDESVLVHLTKALQRADVEPSQFVFELDETSAMGHVKVAQAAVNLLKSLSCTTALEQIGTGSHSLSALKHLDVDYLKLDASVMEDLSNDPEGQDALRAFQETALEMKKATIATAVQDAGSLTVLWQCGIDLAQGDYIQEPTPDLSFEFDEGL